VAFHVFIEKAADPTPEGRARLAASLATKYRLPEAQIAQYLQAGRFRVKSNVDEVTARKFGGELQVLGAIVVVEDATTGARLSLSGAPTRVAPAPAPAPPAAAPPAAKVASVPGASAPATGPGGQRFESGLAAAFSVGAGGPPTNLGALDDMAGISLASLDGGVDESFSGPVGLSAPVPSGPAKLPTSAFSAPDEVGALPLDLVDDPRKKTAAPAPPVAAPAPQAHAARPAGTPRPMPAAHADEPLDLAPSAARPPAPAAAPVLERTSLAGMQVAAAPTPRPRVPAPPPIEGGPLARYFVEKPRARLLVGAAFALGLGFGAVSYYASGAEDEKFGKIRDQLSRVQDAASTQSSWEALDAPDGARPLARKSMERARNRIRSNSAALWVLVSSGLAFVWFRKLA
jgi:hypothetical protein